MKNILDLERYPLERPNSPEYAALVVKCQADLARDGMFNLVDFLRSDLAQAAADALKPAMVSNAFTHKRRHNVYFKKSMPDIADDHPALKKFYTINHVLCADQLIGNVVTQIYEWAPLTVFLAKTMNKAGLYQMQDPLARVNVMAYPKDAALNWHFDRAEFTTTLLLQAPLGGGEFEYRTDLRSADDPNYEGVARLLNGLDPKVQRINATPGTLNVFRGINTPHRVTSIEGDRDRMIAVFSFYDRPDVIFTKEEQTGFYGRHI
jgi:hypothetical protein